MKSFFMYTFNNVKEECTHKNRLFVRFYFRPQQKEDGKRTGGLFFH